MQVAIFCEKRCKKFATLKFHQTYNFDAMEHVSLKKNHRNKIADFKNFGFYLGIKFLRAIETTLVVNFSLNGCAKCEINT